MIDSIRVHAVTAPLAVGFDHATHRRTHTASVLVAVGLTDGCRGWGEGAPRRYVTGETVDTVVDALSTVESRWLAEAVDTGSVTAAVDGLAALDLAHRLGRDRPAPAAAAALETAVLDAVGHAAGVALADPVGRYAARNGLRPTSPAPVSVSLVIDLSRPVATTLDLLPPASRTALTHVKVKAGNDPDRAVARVAEATARLGADTTVSLDVNGAWAVDQVLAVAPRLIELGVAWVEEPTTPRDWSGMAAIRRTGLPVMLDESCVDEEDLTRAVAAGAATHVNVRVSKCGGVLPSVRLAALADRLGVARQLGVQVAEVGPLWAAGRTLATTLSGWCAVEAGRGDEWFRTPLTEPAFAVDRTRHRAAPLTGPGLGVVPTPALLAMARPPVTA